ncbi:MAG TPA: plastocyanin/azurin family copper-binding protein [Opitutaceae bacterium]|nr:plastocyanin/azurin family copper-binding protein [Opitutaceae bacterium]
MKTTFLASFALAAAFVAGCSKSETASAPAASATPAPAATAPAAGSGPQVVNIQANDTMKYDVTRIEATPGQDLKVVLTNVGSMPKTAMAHNWVLLKAGSDPLAFSTAAAAATTTNYIPAALQDQIIAHIDLLGPKESGEVAFKAPSAPGEYPFLCTFPAHFLIGMKGVLVVK